MAPSPPDLGEGGGLVIVITNPVGGLMNNGHNYKYMNIIYYVIIKSIYLPSSGYQIYFRLSGDSLTC